MMQEMWIDNDPLELDNKFPASLSLESFSTLIEPMEKYPLNNCNIEYGECDENLYSLKKWTSSGSYLNICEDCEHNSNKTQVCECCSMQEFLTLQTGKDSMTQSNRVSDWKVNSDTEGSKLEGSETVVRTETGDSSKCRFSIIEEGGTTHHGSLESVELAINERELADSGTDFDIVHTDNDSGIECSLPSLQHN